MVNTPPREPGIERRNRSGRAAGLGGARQDSASRGERGPGTGSAGAQKSAKGPDRSTPQRPVLGAGTLVATLGKMGERLDQAAQLPSWQLTSSDVQDTLEMIGLVRHQLERLETVAAAEAIERKLADERGLSDVDYLVATEGLSAPAPNPAHAARLNRLAVAHAASPNCAQHGTPQDDGVEPGATRSSELLRDEVIYRFHAGLLSTNKTDMLLRYHDEAGPLSEPQAFSQVMGIMTRNASDDHLPSGQYGPMGKPGERVPGMREKELKLLIKRALRGVKPEPDLHQDEQRQRNARSMRSIAWENGCTEYRLVLDPEAAAILDTAISSLSAPDPHCENGPDPRTAPQRRADALLMIVQRGISSPGQAPKTEKAKLLITIGYQDLKDQLRGSGLSTSGHLLSAHTLRKIACDAAIIPAILGTKNEILNMGRQQRLFTPAQRKAMYHRDQGCSFPHCTIPATWTDAHHITHWADGGPTDLSNGALLCPRHHTHVHTKNLTATITATEVTWHL